MGERQRKGVAFSVVVAALGYFVDLYDIVIFGVVRLASLRDLGIEGEALTSWGQWLFNLQLVGMLIGGFAWGVIGDRLGRRFALLATIAMYSLANIANAFVVSVEQYAVLRFVAGFGLAGELGAGVTLIAEILPRRLRGYGTTVISFLGLLGAITASQVGGHFDWRVAYFVGGAMGLVVLALRWIGLRESAMFEERRGAAREGSELGLIFASGPRLARFLRVIAVGVPIWYVSALFVTFAPEFGRGLGLGEPLVVADVLAWQAVGLAIGSALSGLAGEWLRSRKRVVWISYAVLVAGIAALTRVDGAQEYLAILFVIGLAQGYWTAYLTLSAEQFGTNIRATVTTSVPNVVRALAVPANLAVTATAATLGWVGATLAVGALVFALAAVSLWQLAETYGKELDYLER